MPKYKAVIITTDGTKSVVEFNERTSYETLSKAVGGYIECVSMRNGLDMWCNEEGKLTGLPQNPTATAIWNDSYGDTDVIVGNVIFTFGVDEDGNTLGLSDEQIKELMEYDRQVWLIR